MYTEAQTLMVEHSFKLKLSKVKRFERRPHCECQSWNVVNVEACASQKNISITRLKVLMFLLSNGKLKNVLHVENHTTIRFNLLTLLNALGIIN